MTTAELQAIARDILPPVGASVAIAMVDHEPGSLLSNGYPSGLGGRTTFRAGFLVNGRQRIAVGPEFEDGRVARRLVKILNGEATAPRPAPVIPADLPTGANEETVESDQERTGAPLSIAGSRLCAGCGLALPPDARPNRRTHGLSCRVAASRKRGGPGAANAPSAVSVDPAVLDVTLSRAQRPSEADPSPTRSGQEPVPPVLTRSARSSPSSDESATGSNDLTLGLPDG